MNFDKTDPCEHDDDYGHFCVLEENLYANNYVQRVYLQNNRYISLFNYEKPSLYPPDYYYDNYIRITIPNQNKFDKENTQKKYRKNDHDDDNGKGLNKKIFIMVTQLCVFSLFVSAVVIIITMR